MHKSLSRVHSIDKSVISQLVDMSIIFATDSDKKVIKNDASLYQDILRYGMKHPTGFKFTEIGKWLLVNNAEFSEEYSGSKAHVPNSTKLALKRHRIERHLDNLITLDLIYKKMLVKSEKNHSYTHVYDLTEIGIFLSEFLFDQTRVKILEIIDAYARTRGSYSLAFISKFFNKCKENGTFQRILFNFSYAVMPNSKMQSGQEFLRLFLGLDHSINWILADPASFLETINELDEETRRMVLFQFKMEIEEYYNKNYLTQEHKLGKLISTITTNTLSKKFGNQKYAESFADNQAYDFRNIVAIPGKKWQSLRFKNLTNYLKIVLPGFCTGCNTEQPFLIDIFEYFNYIKAAYGPYPYDGVSGDCPGCGKFHGTGCRVVQLPYFVTPWANTAWL
jgi:hypothetical protein